jgi:hypothetical protein
LAENTLQALSKGMNRLLYPFFFDRNDHELLRIVNEVLDWGPQARSLHSLLVEHMHPQGIKEMAASRGLRIAYAIAGLLGSFEKGKAEDRLMALRSLRDEVFFSTTTYYKKNTARVLLQIMKELLRNRGNELKQLKLAHDFRLVSTGNPRRCEPNWPNTISLRCPKSGINAHLMIMFTMPTRKAGNRRPILLWTPGSKVYGD